MGSFEKILKDLKNPSSPYRGAPFWAWNGKIEKEELRRQVRIMKEMGLGGFFMHSRVGLDTPYLSKEWFECINTCAEESKKIGMLAYLYDEDRWPSGFAGGLVTKDKKFRMRHLVMTIINDKNKIDWKKNVIGVFITEFEENIIKKYRKVKRNEKIKNLSSSEKILVFSVKISKKSRWYNGYTYLDTLNPEAVRKFIKVTHENYKKYCGKYFGSIIPGIFTDEPNYGNVYFHYDPPTEKEISIAIPWTEKLPFIFKKRYGYDILEYLPEIYFDLENKEISKVRYHYFDCITYLFVESFAKQIGEWCERNNLLFTGHILAEDTLLRQAHVVGSCMRFYEHMQAPGMDLLTEHRRIFNTAKQVSSVARQFERKWRLTETYGCTGWDFPFAGHKALGDWQVALGINLRCQHLSWYTMLGEAKRDYPASIFYQSPWWNYYKYVEDYFARIHLIMTQGKEIRDLLVIHPIESMWAIYKMPKWDENKKEFIYSEDIKKLDEMYVKLCDVLLSAHIDFDYGDEEILSRWSKVIEENGETILKVNKANYKYVLVPPLITIRSSTLKLLKKFKEKGGKIIFVKEVPSYVDCEFSNEVKKFAEGCIIVSNFEEAITYLEEIRRVSIKDENDNEIKEILYLLREDEDNFYLFVCNTGMEWENIEKYYPVRERKKEFKNVIIKGYPDWKYKPIEIDPVSGNYFYPDIIKKENGFVIKTDFSPIESHLYVIPKKGINIDIKEKKKYIEIKKEEIKQEEVDYILNEPNVLVLDMPYFKIGDNEWKGKLEILKVDKEVRKYLGIQERGGAMVQPWARKKNVNLKNIEVDLKYEFYVEKIPNKGMSIAIEKPELYEIYINRYKLFPDMKNGWWVDKSLEKINFSSSLLNIGKNEILLKTNYSEDHPGFEIIYLLGDFGVKIEEGNLIITSLPEKLKIGDWTLQGLPFYSGNLGYVFNVDKIDFKENQKIFLKISDFRGVGLRVIINGKEVGIIGWPPYEIEITDFVKEEFNLIIEILGHRRNSHGPLHYFEKWPEWTGPGQFVSEGNQWIDEYQIIPCGLMKNPEIIIKEER
ncbi:MAG: hypothetical protein NC926_03145 [Candidatus Omnitrophica bacterium]|nr:hypothetical protein [Candidatus Omnitrophota bacterium]